ncbi:AB hydrolase superfamily protein c1039.03-like [Plakobranchus ocellatus]|uniref:AB hydrolase superfamily protein c1039.03-like n=1 Tax=Plakobranchus ocellatus TaxID=259542 RepID=A0AAV4C484_9GAST|nr:AB hydrolase superfamily protein c1039.03-like [Plakobranchus ocellatus]
MDVLDTLKSKYKLNSESENFLRMRLESLSENGDIGKITKEKYAEVHNSFNEKIAADFDGNTKEFFVPCAGVPNGIPIDAIKPKNCARRPGILVHFHGGSNSFGSRKTSEAICKLLARDLKCVVVNVEYRTAPEHKFPAMFDDGKAVVRWVIMNKSLVGGENDSKVGVIGSSTGGNIAATVAFEVPGLDYQILVYPLVDWRCEDPSFEEFEFSGSSTNLSDIVRNLIDANCNSEKDKVNVRASPLLRSDFTVLPPTLLIIADVDHYRHSNYEFKSKLKAANAVCESKLMKGAVHGFFSIPGLFEETNLRAREIIAQFYKKYGVC